MKTRRRGRFLAETGCQWCPLSSHLPTRWAGTCDSHLDTSQNDGLGGCRGNPEEVSHAEWGGPRDLHDCVQEPLGSGTQLHPLTSFMSNLLLYPPLNTTVTTGFLSCVSISPLCPIFLIMAGRQQVCACACACVLLTQTLALKHRIHLEQTSLSLPAKKTKHTLTVCTSAWCVWARAYVCVYARIWT